jgi:transposase
MFMNGTSISYVGTHSFTKGYIEKLKELNDYRINGYLRIIESLNVEINTVSKKILLLAQEDEMARLLMTVPGIGYYSALLIVSEIGDINSGNENLRLSVLLFIIVMDSGSLSPKQRATG